MKLFKLIISILFMPLWHLQLLFSRNKKLWIFGAWFGQKNSDNAFAIYEYLLENRKDLHPVWITRSKIVYNKLIGEKKPVVMCNSLKGIWLNLRAGVVFINNGQTDVNQYFINGAKQIWVWHGMPMKKILNDQRAFVNSDSVLKLKRIIRTTFFPYLNFKVDYVLNCSDFFTPFMISAFGIESDKLLTLGYPRNDVFFTNKKERILSIIDNTFQNPRKILYMPTFRVADINDKSFSPFASFGFSVNEFNKFLDENNYVFLHKGHNQDGDLSSRNKLGERFISIDDTNCDNIYTLLKDIDVLITDYSSVYFDFLLLNKPIILAPFDFENYISNSRPLYFDYYKELPHKKAHNWNEVLDLLQDVIEFTCSEKETAKFHAFQDGKSTERLVNHISNLA